MKFSFQEYGDIVYHYGKADGNTYEAQRLYGERFPHRQLPDRRVFQAAFARFCETGTASRPCETVRSGIRSTVQDTVLQAVAEDPSTSVRKVAQASGISKSHVHRTLKYHKVHPYHFTPVQSLHDGDCERRLQFCTLILEKDSADENFLKRILWTDESTFNREGITNFHNLHHYALENPHMKLQTKHQNRFSVNVWAGVIGTHLIGPFYLPEKLTAVGYLQFLQIDLPTFLEDIPLNTLANMHYQHDGCPAHSSNIVKQFLNEEYGESWIGRNGPIKWPARSPDMTPLDFYVWGRAKELVYNEEIRDRCQLLSKIDSAFEVIRQEMTINTTTTEIRKRLSKCITQQGSHFENVR